jgi:hypothetical protein
LTSSIHVSSSNSSPRTSPRRNEGSIPHLLLE